jgi:hypothetical protein
MVNPLIKLLRLLSPKVDLFFLNEIPALYLTVVLGDKNQFQKLVQLFGFLSL